MFARHLRFCPRSPAVHLRLPNRRFSSGYGHFSFTDPAQNQSSIMRRRTHSMRDIFDKIAIGDLRLKNRLVRSATWEGVAAPDGGIDE